VFPRFRYAALRSHGRYRRETQSVEFDEALAVLSLLGVMSGSRPKVPAFALGDLLSRSHGLERACEILMCWRQG
jgi:hypothetical protein